MGDQEGLSGKKARAILDNLQYISGYITTGPRASYHLVIKFEFLVFFNKILGYVFDSFYLFAKRFIRDITGAAGLY